jgi:hypothetical protein
MLCYWDTFSVRRILSDERDGRGSGPHVKVDIRSSESSLCNLDLQ